MMADKLKRVYQIERLPTSLNLDFPGKSVLRNHPSNNLGIQGSSYNDKLGLQITLLLTRK